MKDEAEDEKQKTGFRKKAEKVLHPVCWVSMDRGQRQKSQSIWSPFASTTWRDGAGGPWREMLRAEHVPGIRDPQSVLLNSSPGFYKSCKHI